MNGLIIIICIVGAFSQIALWIIILGHNKQKQEKIDSYQKAMLKAENYLDCEKRQEQIKAEFGIKGGKK